MNPRVKYHVHAMLNIPQPFAIRESLQNSLEFSLEFWVLLTKLPKKYFGRLKFKFNLR